MVLNAREKEFPCLIICLQKFCKTVQLKFLSPIFADLINDNTCGRDFACSSNFLLDLYCAKILSSPKCVPHTVILLGPPSSIINQDFFSEILLQFDWCQINIVNFYENGFVRQSNMASKLAKERNSSLKRFVETVNSRCLWSSILVEIKLILNLSLFSNSSESTNGPWNCFSFKAAFSLTSS